MESTNKWLIGMLLILLLTSVYVYNSLPIKRNKLIIISGTLKNLPRFGSTGGDFFYPYMILTLNEYKEQFILRDCSYKSLDVVGARKMIIGDSLKVETSVDNGAYYVFGLSSSDGYDLLDFNKYTTCNSNRWKTTFFWGILVFIILIIRTIIIPTIRRIFLW
jgi:hypothetical protein